MKSDARYLINKKKWNKQVGNQVKDISRVRKTVPHGTLDARKILDSKRRKTSESSFSKVLLGTHETTVSLSRKESASTSKAKHVELSSDGNIWITSQSKSSQQVIRKPRKLPFGMDITVSARNKQLQNSAFQWEPPESEMDDLEILGIDDVLDMESLPAAAVSSKLPSEHRLQVSRKSLAEQVLSMKNTMVADQIMSPSGQESVKVLVTNLRLSVSKEDIMELFGDVGPIKSADLIKPGTAMIEFYDKQDANKACDTYHNRLLDGQPMKCYVQPNSVPQRSMIAQRLGERVQDRPVSFSSVVSPQLTNSRLRLNPRDVQFTVKLT